MLGCGDLGVSQTSGHLQSVIVNVKKFIICHCIVNET
jgi:hypothetical protein